MVLFNFSWLKISNHRISDFSYSIHYRWFICWKEMQIKKLSLIYEMKWNEMKWNSMLLFLRLLSTALDLTCKHLVYFIFEAFKLSFILWMIITKSKAEDFYNRLFVLLGHFLSNRHFTEHMETLPASPGEGRRDVTLSDTSGHRSRTTNISQNIYYL